MASPQAAFDKFRPETAWKPYFPTSSAPWNEQRVAHLYRRAAFGGTYEQIQRGVGMTPGELIEEVLHGGPKQEKFEADYDRLADGVLSSNQQNQLKALWMFRLLNSPHPLREKMTLFWHDHFATSNAKVNNISLMHRQMRIFHEHGLGHFGEMLQAIARDPAMLIWLDSNTNKKGRPNENLAREILELFSLGVGNYTETDIQEAARALTGWSVNGQQAVFSPSEFDKGQKTILGETGNWGAGDVVRIALSQKACSMFLVRKLFKELISDSITPQDEMLEPLAEEFRIRNYDITWLVSTMLQSWVFYSDAAINQKVKAPVDFIVGTVRMLDGRTSPAEMVNVCDQLGQSLYYPPSVKGWDGGSDWLNSTTLLHRQNLMFDLTKGKALGLRTDPARLSQTHNLSTEEELVRFFLNLFLQNPNHPSASEMAAYLAEERSNVSRGVSGGSPQLVQTHLARTAAHLVLTLPEYQLG